MRNCKSTFSQEWLHSAMLRHKSQVAVQGRAWAEKEDCLFPFLSAVVRSAANEGGFAGLRSIGDSTNGERKSLSTFDLTFRARNHYVIRVWRLRLTCEGSLVDKEDALVEHRCLCIRAVVGLLLSGECPADEQPAQTARRLVAESLKENC